MNSKKLLKVALCVAIAAVMVLIFYLSSENASKSTETSDRVIETILENLYPKYKTMSESERQAAVDDLEFAVRKTAHFSVYCLLGILSCAIVFVYTNRPRLRVRVPLAISAAYAISDEIHQIFVPGRSCELRDMLIDTSGALLGIAITIVILNFLTRRNRPRGNSQ